MTEEIPRIYEHAQSLYAELDSRATLKEDRKMFVGSMVEAFRAIGVSQAYYSKLYGALREMGCIEVVVSGRGGGRESQVVLHAPPSLDGFLNVYAPQPRYLTKGDTLDTIGQRVSNIEGRLGTANIESVLIDYHRRLEFLEEQLGAVYREVQNLGKAT